MGFIVAKKCQGAKNPIVASEGIQFLHVMTELKSSESLNFGGVSRVKNPRMSKTPVDHVMHN